MELHVVKMIHASISVLVFLLALVPRAKGWRRWTADEGPLARHGHTLEMFGDKVVLFGGRGRDHNKFHLPKTFELVSNNGKLEFASYDQHSVPRGSREDIPLVENDPFLDECLPLIDSDPVAAANRSDCKFSGSKESIHERENYIPTSVYFNDLWWYDMDCDRFGDAACEFEGWHNVDPGAARGGCELISSMSICTHPTERFGHGSQIVGDQAMVVFGGFSHFCEDFCDDAWMFVLPRSNETLPGDEEFGVPAGFLPQGRRWLQLEQLSSPGKRWKMASVLVDSSTIFLFGGHRMWQGYADENSREMHYSKHNDIPEGGYLKDLWKWNLSGCLLNEDTLNAKGLEDRLAFYSLCQAQWEQVNPLQNCTEFVLEDDTRELRPGYAWADRHNMLCRPVWPAERSGHGLAYFEGNLYLHGGYRTFFPYPASAGPGARSETAGRKQAISLQPFPAYNFFLDDFWRFDVATGYWHVVESASPVEHRPASRTEHSLVATRDLLVMFGGYHANHYMNDFWFFNTTSLRWLHKKQFVHPIYPPNCIEGGEVFAYPTSSTVLDGLHGRTSEHVRVNLTRRQAPGWDGCRDRLDGRTDLPQQMQWNEPSQRAHHAVAFSDKYESMLLFGGHGPVREWPEQVQETHEVLERSELWAFNMHQCINNCSDNGDCSYGFCKCNSGYYGYDCSNTSCPGDFCYYDDITNEQVCNHCCHAPYVHADDDVYIADYGKQSCSHKLPGHSNGVCNGDGQCLCAPSFVGLDCAMKDCPLNVQTGKQCSGNGWCSQEYPVSRCKCEPGFTGATCEEVQCLNNCSYPNGECDLTTGVCSCILWPDVYNRERPWRKFEGLDCSFLIPYAAAEGRPAISLAYTLFFTIHVTLLVL